MQEKNSNMNEENTGNMTEIENAVEAILFTMGDSVETDRLAKALDLSIDQTRDAVESLQRRYDEENRGIQIIRLDQSYQMCTRSDYFPQLIRIASIPRKINLTDVLLETLSIIAYKQPITKLEIEKIRGVKSDHAVNKLVEYDLVTELGRMDAPGRPILFGTTEEFLRHFGVSSLEDLPAPDPDQKAGFQKEAEREISEKLK